MLLTLMTVAALAHAAPTQPEIYEVEFAPLRGAERPYARLGPVGPFYPDVAARARKSGVAILTCSAGAAGALKQCKVTSETPAGYNFGAAARVMADRKRIRVVGAPAEGEMIQVRVPFEPRRRSTEAGEP